jgi:probable selenium-dependent hydroxylase accessory protein YqeC
VTATLRALLGVRDRDLVAFVGAGGKSTLLFRLGSELAASGASVVATTTTKMGSDQTRRAPTVRRSSDPASVAAALLKPGPVMVVATDDGHKVTGPSPEMVDQIYAEAGADYVLVEADGARGRSFKTPAEHEPVIPAASTLVVIVMGIDAIGHPIRKVCHRPELVATLAGLRVDDALDIDAVVRVLRHPDGVMRAVPEGARVAVAVTKVSTARRSDAEALATALLATPRIERCALVSSDSGVTV